jgi:hypothetical protein
MDRIELDNLCQPGNAIRVDSAKYARTRKAGLLGLVVAAAFLGTAPIARAGCVEQSVQNKLAEPRALTSGASNPVSGFCVA